MPYVAMSGILGRLSGETFAERHTNLRIIRSYSKGTVKAIEEPLIGRVNLDFYGELAVSGTSHAKSIFRLLKAGLYT